MTKPDKELRFVLARKLGISADLVHDIISAIKETHLVIPKGDLAELVKPLEFRDSYGVIRADTKIGTYSIAGKVAAVRTMDYNLVADEQVLQAHHVSRVISLLKEI